MDTLPKALLTDIPETLHDLVKKYYATSPISDLNFGDNVLQQWVKVAIASDYAAEAMTLDLLNKILPGIEETRQQDYLSKALSKRLNNIQDLSKLMQALREFKQQETIRIIWRDINELADLPIILQEITQLADVILKQSYRFLYDFQCQRLGTPCDAKGNAIPMLIIALGKLGGEELNLSSDVDLIFCYPCNGETQGQRKSTSNEQFFIQLGQTLIKTLHEVTTHGFVYRVDMRLRPYGESGPLAMNFISLENYYQQQGRHWERYALTKARILTGDLYYQQRIASIIEAFVYRRYLDYGVIDGLRKLKVLINSEIKNKNLQANIKRGMGGIREAEFIVQAFSLIRGGQEKELNTHNFLKGLQALHSTQSLPTPAVKELRAGYCYLRILEHRLQALRNRQTQELPNDHQQQARIAFSMGMESWEQCYDKTIYHMTRIHHHFQQMIGEENPSQEEDLPLLKEFTELWLCSEDQMTELLTGLNIQDHQRLQQLLVGMHSSFRYRSMDRDSQLRLDEFMPRLLCKLHVTRQPTEIFERLLRVVEAIMRRSAYLSLLLENPQALNHLIKICSSSPWVSDHIARFPLLLDELLNPKAFNKELTYTNIQDDIQQSLISIPQEDIESQLECLRRSKLSHLHRIAANDIINNPSVHNISRQLSDLASALVTQTTQLAQMNHKEYRCPDFMVVAYGKLGSHELNYDSDLDLVFIFGQPDGNTSLSSPENYIRLTQQLIHFLQMRLPTGTLYEVDTRLRPSGQSGLLVSSFTAYIEYQLEKAWTWEHQALVRARVIYGPQDMQDAFNGMRERILRHERQADKLIEDIITMRQRMRAKMHKGFNIKQCPGGIIDIEFIAQYLMLAHAHEHAELATLTSTTDIIQAIRKNGLIEETQAENLVHAYDHYRHSLHHAMLQSHALDKDQFSEYCETVIKIWQDLFNQAGNTRSFT